MLSRFVIAVKDLAIGGSEFRFQLTTAWLKEALSQSEYGPRPGQDGQLEVRATKSGNDVLVQGSITAQLESPCVRCLEAATVPIDAEFSVLMTPRPVSEAAPSDGEEVDWEYFDGEQIVLDGLVREHILLEVPMNPLCSESCKGVDLGMPKPAEVDHRLAPLARLREKIQKKE